MVDVKESTLREFTPIDDFYYSFNRWWLVVAMVLAGGILGWVFHRFQPQVYETKAIFAVNIDFGQTGPLNEFEQDHAIGMFKAVFLSTPVLERLGKEATARQIPPDALSYGRNVFIERKQYIYELRVKNSDPEVAVEVANLWAEIAYSDLIKAHEHSLKAASLRAFIKGLENCLNLNGNNTSSLPLCEQSTLDEIRNEINKLQQELQVEVEASQGLIPSLSFTWSEKAETPERPIAFGRNRLIFAGAMIGFLIGAILASARFKSR